MRIAVIGNFDKEISNASNGGTEVFTYFLTRELAKRDFIESIDLYAVGTNQIHNPKIKYISTLPQPTRQFVENNPLLSQISKNRSDFLTDVQSNIAVTVFEKLLNTKYDLIHDNSTSSVFNSLIDLIPTNIITTLHTNISSPSILIPYALNLLSDIKHHHYYVCIGEHQRQFSKQNNIKINILGTVHNGIDIENYAYSLDTPSINFGLWVGRISAKHDKGIKEALTATERANKHLTVLTSVDDEVFFNLEVKPLIHDKVNFIPRGATPKEKNELYQNAGYFIYPIIWEEPFGLIFLEAMAAGTPVIAYAKGAVPEILVDGETGFIVNSSNEDIRGNWIIKKTGIEGLCEAIEKINGMPKEEYQSMRFKCRERVEKYFTVEKMVDGYESLYKNLVNKQ